MEKYFQEQVLPILQPVFDHDQTFNHKRSKARAALKEVLNEFCDGNHLVAAAHTGSSEWEKSPNTISQIVNNVSAPMTCVAWCVMFCHSDNFGGSDSLKSHLGMALRDPDACHTGRDEKPVYLLSKYIDDVVMTEVSRLLDLYGLNLS